MREISKIRVSTQVALIVTAWLASGCQNPLGQTNSTDSTFHPGVSGSLSASLITVSSSVIPLGSTSTVVLTLYNSDGSRADTPGQSVTFYYDSGSSTGTFSSVVDNGDGSYTSIFTGTGEGTAVEIHANVVGAPVTSTPPTIQVGVALPSNLVYSSNPAVYTLNQSIQPNIPSSQGGMLTQFSVSPALPQGLALDPSSGIISGTPSAITSEANYVVTGSNASGQTSVAVSITVNDGQPANLSYAQNPAVYTIGVPVSNSPSHLGGTPTAYSITPTTLPVGLALNTSTGVISGTPTAITATQTYSVVASNTGGSSSPLSLSITVNDVVPSALNYAPNPAVYTIGGAVHIVPSHSGGAPTSYAISPTTLPAGMTFNTTTGVISGTASAITSTKTFSITATNTGGTSSPASLSITVNDVAPSSLTYTPNPVTYTVGNSVNMVPSYAGGTPTSYSISPTTLPAGMAFNTTTGVISGTASAITSTRTFSITATNTGGTSSPASLSITVNDVIPSALTYSPNPAVFILEGAVSITPSNSGGVPTSYAITPTALPTGMSFSTTTGIISGTASAITATQTFNITATNTGGTSSPVSLSITVNPVPPSTISYSPSSNTFDVGQSVSLTPTTTGGVPTLFSISPTTLPAGLSFSTTTGVISGQATAIALSSSYQVTASNAGGSTPAFTLTIAVNNPVPTLPAVSNYEYPSNAITVGNTLSVTFENTNTGNNYGMSYACQYNRTLNGTFSTPCSSLPGTFSFSNTTGVMSWTPNTSDWGAYQFQVIGTNSAGPSAADLFVVDIFQGYPNANLVLDLVADFATLSSPATNNPMTTTWKNIFTTGSSDDGTLENFPSPGLTTNGWTGSGTTASPYALAFNGSGTSVNLGSSIGSNSEAMLTAWVSAANIAGTKTGTVIATNNNSGAGLGLTIRQSAQYAGTFEVETVGSYEYTQEVLSGGASSLYGYWRLNEGSGTTLVDSSGNSNNGYYYLGTTKTAPTYNSTGPLTGDSTSKSVNIAYNSTGPVYGTATTSATIAAPGPSIYTEEVWFKATSGYAVGGKMIGFGSSATGSSSNYDRHIWMDNTGKVDTGIYNNSSIEVVTSPSAYNDGFWHQAVATFTSNGTTGTLTLFIDGAQVNTASGTAYKNAQTNYAGYWRIGYDNLNSWTPATTSYEFQGQLAEISIYKSVLSSAEILKHFQLGLRRCHTSAIATNNAWNFLAATYDGTNTDLYLNGALACTMSYGTSSGLNPGDANLTLGGTSTGGDSWSGLLGDFKAYTSGTGTDVTNIYNATSPTY